MPACLINPRQCLWRCLNSPHSSAVLALAMTEPHWVSDGMQRLMSLHQPLPAPQGEVCSGGPLVFLSPNGPRLPVSNNTVLLSELQQYLFSYFYSLLLSTYKAYTATGLRSQLWPVYASSSSSSSTRKLLRMANEWSWERACERLTVGNQ